MHHWKNKAVTNLPPSGIRAIFERASDLQSSGRRVFQLALGRPDMDTPIHIKNAAVAALDAGMVHYAPTTGITTLRQALAEVLSSDFGWQVNPDTEILVTSGAGEAIYIAMTAILNPGDQVLIGEHCWINYPAVAQLLGTEVIYYRMASDHNFEPDLDDIKSKCNGRTRMIILNSPTNPTGAVFSEETIRSLAELSVERDLLVLSDECYRKIIFPGGHHISPASIQGMRERTIVVDSFSKTYSMTGWRIGYLIASPSLMPSIVKVHQYNCGTVCSFGQAAATVALTSSQENVAQSREEFCKRRDLVINHIKDMPELECHPPLGTFYIYPRIKRAKITSFDFSLRLLEIAGVATVPGSVFGPGGEGYIRISCTLPQDELNEAMILMKESIAEVLGN